MAASGGLLTSFLDAFQGLQQMEHQKRQDERLAAEQEVDKVLRQQEIKLREQGLRQQETRSNENLELRRDIEKRREGDSANRQTDRVIKQGLAQKRFDQSAQRLSAGDLKKVVDAGEDVFRTLVMQGVSAEEARAYAEDHKAQLAGQMGFTMPAPEQTFAGQGQQGPMTLSGGAPSTAGSNLGVLPKIAASMASLKAGDNLKAAQETLAETRNDLLQQTIADRVSEKAVKDEYLKNRNRLQVERLKLMPLEATAKRLGMQTEKLRQQKLQGEIDMQPIERAIKQLNRNKAEKSATWSEDAKYMRQWLTKEYDTARMGVTNSLSHLSSLKETQRQTDSQITEIEGLKNKGKATPEDFARLDALRATRMERAASIGFYQGEYDKAAKMRNGFKTQMDGLLGISETPLTTGGTPVKGFSRNSQLIPSGGGVAPLPVDAVVRVKTVREAMNLPKGTIFIDPKGNRRKR